jgi:ParB family chromosome partitioning protein
MADNRQGKRGLGRGLSALMADVAPRPQGEAEEQGAPRPAEQFVPIEDIHPNPDQPRRRFGEDELKELAASIREKGVLQPLIVRKNPRKPSVYEIVAGERRWRAAQLAQLHELPVIVRDYSDEEVLEIAIIENVQRADLNPIEEAAGYRQLMDRFGHTQEKLAEALGKSRSHIANLLRLLQLPPSVQELVRNGSLTMGHARALITAENPVELATEIVRKGLSVRQAEKLAKRPGGQAAKKKTAPKEKDADTRALESDLSAALGMKVTVEHRPGEEGGQVVIRYKSLDELDDLCRILTSG